MSRAERRALIDREAAALPVSRQCRLLSVSRASVHRRPAEINEEDCAVMALIDRQYLARPYYGSRRMAAWLATRGHVVNRKRVRRLMRLAGLAAIYQRPNTSQPASAHKIYPYLLGGISRPEPVRKSAGLHLRRRLRLSHDRGPPRSSRITRADIAIPPPTNHNTPAAPM